MKKHIDQFVRETTSRMTEFNVKNNDHLKKVIREALAYYEMKSHEEVEETEQGTIEYLYIHSMIEENLLSKVITQTINDDFDHSIEEIYQGYVIRRH
ncbi:MAG: DUF6407 family protein [Bacillaceae bacterium]|nr:DUF6407 family protein [Bacillaceae bacterium]